jgi:hypothetical protein
VLQPNTDTEIDIAQPIRNQKKQYRGDSMGV